ncbi:MAG: 4-hydroxythreonine-4-phosphate dehydrogenase PdxA [Planctomycetota bacterium]|nr:4-hydroxythreonine-4-phosphate dehydrogenase PdxA [Planctomycetota bacterium]MCX8039163.1 4-hydroxythreonine-4-phosphate dehydrogenase PdxA [Planctomycetota bacterium]MDW8372139.1 4-hydroxythreonine-4-phosphate dehydrogenase PdxA [Planctomycetota bacterium]
MRPLAITIGDPAGIGPEIVLKACADPALRELPLLVIGMRALLARVADVLGLPLPAAIEEPPLPGFDAAAVQPGRIAALHGAVAAACIEHAIAGCLAGRFAALVTAPVHKQALHLAGVPFPGHTEWLAARSGVRDETMLMYHEQLAVALVTVHQSLASVPASLDALRIVRVGVQLAEALRRLRGREPRLAVLGLNPHAGEGGLFGDEERRCIVPAVGELLQLGILADGPLPPDAAFTPAARARYDGWVCMYHDQGLIPFKAFAFDEGVNVTLGLPIVRTSVDHGTAFDIAWQGRASHRSLVSAIRLAARLAGG